MYQVIGEVGTWAILAITVIAYLIWRFNPVFNLPSKKSIVAALPNEDGEIIKEEISSTVELPIEKEEEKNAPNFQKGDVGVMQLVPENDTSSKHEITLVEKDAIPEQEEDLEEEEEEIMELIAVPESLPSKKSEPAPSLELEIKSVPDKVVDEPAKEATNPKLATPYDPILDLRDYKYPSLDLLEAYGGEKIVQDSNELESNKNQIINTLKNYDITIQKISATVGPTVTLYEIIPAAGVRISRIKNLEDDIALSLGSIGYSYHCANPR
jgi:S-DNA-T family DNA segregation ATPase FtsK/SpoIIIE